MGYLDRNKRRLVSALLVLLGNVLYAFTVKVFLLPAELISCGTTGIALVVNHLTGLPLTEFIFVFNIAMLCLGWWMLGKKFAMTRVYFVKEGFTPSQNTHDCGSFVVI